MQLTKEYDISLQVRNIILKIPILYMDGSIGTFKNHIDLEDPDAKRVMSARTNCTVAICHCTLIAY